LIQVTNKNKQMTAKKIGVKRCNRKTI